MLRKQVIVNESLRVSADLVIIDLSYVIKLTDPAKWVWVEECVKSWKEKMNANATFLGVMDSKTWYSLNEADQQSFRMWRNAGRAQKIRFADPLILEIASENRAAQIITYDKYRDFRRDHTWLQGTTRIWEPFLEDETISFRQVDCPPIPEHDISKAVQDAGLKPRGFTNRESWKDLRFDWQCKTIDCRLANTHAIQEDPARDNDVVICPECRQPLTKLGPRSKTREVIFLVESDELCRVPLAQGEAITVGRGNGVGRFDVRKILSLEVAEKISRDHVCIENDHGMIFVRDLGSTNGSSVVRDKGRVKTLGAEKYALGLSDRLHLSRGVLVIRISGKQRSFGIFTPDLSTPPYLRQKDNLK